MTHRGRIAYDGYSHWWVCTCGEAGSPQSSHMGAYFDFALHAEGECVRKDGWLSGETYCATHGRAAGWPCKEAL